MSWSLLSFLAEPWFVIPWYAVGVLGAAYVAYDVAKKNTPLKKAMKWAWPIIVLFFSVFGLALYFATARAPGIGDMESEDEKKHAHREYEKNELRRVNGAVIHCIAGDGLGIMTGMVIARLTGMSFWQEFWFEYAVGFAFGWFIFQYESMTMMTDSKVKALAMAFRGEFFSMLTVMAGMGLVMGYVTPLAATAQPQPQTYAFWGFGMLGLLVGYVFTFPMNWMMVKLGWKHGMGSGEDAREAESKPARGGLLAAQIVLGAASLALLGWLVELRDGTPIRPSAIVASDGSKTGMRALAGGLQGTLEEATRALDNGERGRASHAIDAALRVASIGDAAAPGTAFASVLQSLEKARHAMHIGRFELALTRLETARGTASTIGAEGPPPSATERPSLDRYGQATVVNGNGVMIGEVVGVEGDELRLALGGARDVLGFWDIGRVQEERVPRDAVVLGPSRSLGHTLVALPSAVSTPPVSVAAAEQ